MSNQIRSGAILTYLNIIVSIIVGFGYTPIILRLLGQAQYGVYSLIGSLVAYLSILDLGLGKAVIRYVAQNRIIGSKKREAELNGLFLIIYSIIGFIALIIGVFIYFNFDKIFENTFNSNQLYIAKIMLLCLVINIAVSFPLSVFTSIIQAYERFVFLRIINIMSTFLKPTLALPFLYMGYGATFLVFTATIINIVSLLINLFYCIKFLNIKICFGKYKRNFLWEISGFSFFIFLGIIVDKIYWSTGQIIIGKMLGPTQIAIYAIAIQFITIYTQLSYAIGIVFFPRLTILTSNNISKQELLNLLVKTGRITTFIVSYIIVVFYLVGEKFIFLWAGKDYLLAYDIILILMLSMLISTIQSMFTAMLQAMNRNKYYSSVCILSAIINIFLSIYLLNLYGIMGCAISTTISLLLSTGILMNRYYLKKLQLDIFFYWKQIFKILPGIVIVLFFSNIIYRYFVNVYSWECFLSEVIIYTIIYIIVLYFISMNSYEKGFIRKIKNWARNKE